MFVETMSMAYKFGMFIKILTLSLSFIVISTCLIVLSWLLNTYRYRASLSCIVIVHRYRDGARNPTAYRNKS